MIKATTQKLYIVTSPVNFTCVLWVAKLTAFDFSITMGRLCNATRNNSILTTGPGFHTWDQSILAWSGQSSTLLILSSHRRGLPCVYYNMKASISRCQRAKKMTTSSLHSLSLPCSQNLSREDSTGRTAPRHQDYSPPWGYMVDRKQVIGPGEPRDC